jgi:heme O synthase-like polyprenyltransferase
LKKYFNTALVIEMASLLYGFIHNYYFMSQFVMFIAAILSVVCSIYLFWQCFTNKELKKSKKYIGLFIASIPFLIIIGAIIFVFLLASNSHY